MHSLNPNAIRSRRNRIKARAKALKLIGDKCLICGSTERLCFHEIHGLNHNKDTEPYYYLKHPENFITLCYYHHKFIHAFADMSDKARQQCLNIASALYN